MKRVTWCGAVAFLAVAVLVGCGKSPTNAVQDDALAALKSLRDRGVLTQQEYDAKVATLTGRDEALKALQSLRDRGVLSPEEYAAKVATLQGSSGLGDSLGGGTRSLDVGSTTGAQDNATAGLSAGSELTGGAEVRLASEPNAEVRAPRKAPRAASRRQLAASNLQTTEPSSTVAQSGNAPSQGANSASADSNSSSNPVRSFWTRARAKVQDLGHKIMNRSAQTPPPASGNPQDVQAYGQALLNGNDPSNGNAGDSQASQDSAPRR